ncbi:hypothetical protein AVEN_142151-1 [Araneus ventricosus]|uniref:Uncharacterized protein n=1 Tax=Araneus ventricosus TaxID=182803 RepID=A0A4Y2EJR0_ARAVE|nr:hypothetical protein AVEN_1641-1 [Araneus ventricosus]GBM28550.1 hypothetical protein AVEN_42356-1 [Araneus ventricosus]GBM28559.1 hypothetical protein AVEN_85590-1 [Araneus ventricosus]GBM28566.1 hypothetical protein AVEN_142151-1 [Araneus ventricosus]
MHPIRHWPWALPQLPQEIRFPFYRLLRMWGNRKSPTLCNEMPTNFIISHKESSPQFIVHWRKCALSSELSRRNIDRLIKFLGTNEDLIKSRNYNIVTDFRLEIDTSTNSPPGTRNLMNTQLSC